MEKTVVMVEDVEIARAALRWALHNVLRNGDVVTLLHVFSGRSATSTKKLRRLRLNGFQLALSFKDIICRTIPNMKVEIVVTEGDLEGRRIAAVVNEIGAATLVLGLHDRSFIYRLIIPENNLKIFKCKVLAIKDSTNPSSTTISINHFWTDTDSVTFSQIELSTFSFPILPRPKVPYTICPDPSAIIWRSRPTRTSCRT